MDREARHTARATFTADDVGELISLATRLDELEDSSELSTDQVASVAAELGISRAALDRAIRQRRRRRRADARTAQKKVRKRMRFIRHAVAYAMVVGALILVDALGGGGWWFFYVAAIWGVVLALHGLRFVTGRRGPLERYLTDRELGQSKETE